MSRVAETIRMDAEKSMNALTKNADRSRRIATVSSEVLLPYGKEILHHIARGDAGPATITLGSIRFGCNMGEALDATHAPQHPPLTKRHEQAGISSSPMTAAQKSSTQTRQD